MDAHQVFDLLHDAGLSMALTPEKGLRVTPASALTTELRDLIRASKTVLINRLERMKAANDDASPWRVSVAPGTPPDALARLRAASSELDRKQASIPTRPPDAWCWPHSAVTNGAETDTFNARVKRFTDRGLLQADAEAVADELIQRDREGDDRRVCLECASLRQAGGWRCGNWKQAEFATRVRDALLPSALVQLLQRCPGFTDQDRPEGPLPFPAFIDRAEQEHP